MLVGFVHLSDVHLRHDRDNPALSWADRVVAAVTPEVLETAGVFVVITGDLAFSGKSEEYAHAKQLLDAVRGGLQGRGVRVLETIVVPGNHDCDFDLSNAVRQALLREAVRSPDDAVVSACTVVQAPFRAFADDAKVCFPSGTSVVGAFSVEVDGQNFRFLAYNSAWMSSLREGGASLRAPMPIIEGDCGDGTDPGDPSMVIWLMHHPYPWFDPEDAKALRRHIESTADVVLTGHEHDGGAYTRSYRSGLQVDYVEGGVLQESAESRSSSFNLIVVDVASRRQRVVHFAMEEDLYVAGGPEHWQPLVRNRTRVARLFDHNEAFSATLDDVGVSLNHPRVQQLRLRDVFIYPDVRYLPLSGGGREREIIRDLPSYVATRGKVILIGPEKSGKTSIAKRLCQDLRGADLVTLLADGANFAPRGFEKVRAAIRELIATQLSRESTEPVLQLAKEHRCLIIDNYHLIRFPRAGRAQLLRELESYFGVIVLLASEDLRLEYLSQAPDEAGQHPIFDYGHAEILQLGHVRRHQMIAQWCWLGRDRGEVDDEQVHREVLQAENLLSGVIGKNLIPSYPIFVLILLHQLEAGRPHDTGAGSQGYLYQSLIEATLRRVAPHPHDIDSRFAYLTELAWFISRGGDSGDARVAVERAELRRWHFQYCERQLVDFEYPRYVDQLISVGVLRQEGARVSFCYPYIQYFFEARHLKSHIHQEDVRTLVREFAQRLHDERVATVMVFLVHLSSDPFVLETMIEAAQALFRDFGEWDTDGQTKFLNTLVQQTPRLALLQTSLQQNRVSELQAMDEMEAEDELEAEHVVDSEPESEPESDISFEREIEPILKLNSAFKTIQIIGQILRNYPGSLDGPRKVALAEVCYRLGLRVLGFTFASIEQHGEEFVKGLVAHVVRIRPEAGADRLTLDANAFLFALCERFSFGVVRHISQSLGHHDLAPVFREIEKIGEGRTPFRVIDLSIKLDHAKAPPAEDAVRLYEAERKNTIVATLVRHLVWYHLYLFPTDFKTRQQLCAKLEIEDGQRLIDDNQKLISAKNQG